MKVEGTNVQQTYEKLASMKKINSAADDPAGMAISEKLQAQENGAEQATENAANMQNVAKTAEGALSSIHDGLQRMRELTVQASNGTLSAKDKQAIQKEVEQIKDSISDQVKNTEFNNQKLINGDFANKNAAINDSGKGMKMKIENTGLSELGIKNFDVTNNPDISKVDQAIEKVSEARSDLGATSNRLDKAMSTNRAVAYNQAAANSRITDAEPAKQISQVETNQVLRQYKYFAQQQEVQQQGQVLNLIS